MWDECAIVDDNKFDRLICRRILGRIGLEAHITEFESGESLLEYLDSKSDEKLLIFLDLNMPNMSGLEFLQTIDQSVQFDELRSKVSIQIMSSTTRSSDIDPAQAFNYVHGFIQKPLSIQQVKEVLEPTV